MRAFVDKLQGLVEFDILSLVAWGTFPLRPANVYNRTGFKKEGKMGKRIILGLPAVYDIGSLLRENLQYEGFEVIDLSFDYKGFAYKSTYQRVVNFFRKTVLGDRSYKDKLRFAKHQQLIWDKLASLNTVADFALIIRPDAYSKEVLQVIKSKSKKFIAYQWDGMSRYPWVESYIPLFDKFFVFDPADIRTGSFPCRYLGNFYFTLPRLFETPVSSMGGAYFLGAFNRERLRILTELQAVLTQIKIPSDLKLYSKKKRRINIEQPGICITTETYSYEKNLELTKRAKVLIDITASCHKGLSLRFYECMCFQKKLITTNETVRDYDFYHKDNIFIYGQDDLNDLPSFMNRPYKPVQPRIVGKYGFDRWVRHVLDMPAQKASVILEPVN